MNGLARERIIVIEDFPCSELNPHGLKTSSGLLEIHPHTGRPYELCDVVFAGPPDQLSAVVRHSSEIMPLPVLRRKRVAGMDCGHCRIDLGCRSLVVGIASPFTGLTSVDSVVWSAMEAAAAGADAVELEIVCDRSDTELLHWLITQLGMRKIPVFVNSDDVSAVMTGARAGACAVTWIRGCTEHIRDVNSWVIVRRKGRLQGTDGLSLVFEVISSLLQDVAMLKDKGVDPSRILLDPGFDEGIDSVQAELLMESMRLLTGHRYPLIVEPYRKAQVPEDRLVILARSQLRTLFGGVDFIRARGVVEIAQANALADRMLGTVA